MNTSTILYALCIVTVAHSAIAGDPPLSPKQKTHWAFQPIGVIQPPAVQGKHWVKNPIDAFILAKLESANRTPSRPADALTLLRRVHFDLTGLPPTPEEIEAFQREAEANRETAYEKVIDRLLKSPHYGERWGRHWLDVVRYADSAGYEIDNFYPHAWLYRDYVIRSFNADKPFDRFIHEQIAGDEMFPHSEEAKLGTGFATVGPFAYEGGIARPKVVEYQRLTDLVDTTGAALLGLTVGCARCHDHKYDPISQKDYFGLQAIFAGSEAKPLRVKEGEAKILGARVKPEPVHMLKRGELDAPLEAAKPALIRFLPDKGEATIGRTALARWLTAPENPLTARVIVNRLWQWHFGTGIVATPNDFGLQGEPPSHPELLDWLARDFRENGWSLKRLHKQILMSNTYRQQGVPPRRLEAEILWDHLHAASGTLNRNQYGPAVVPPIDKKYLDTLINKNWKVTDDTTQHTRRGVYLIVRRSITLPLFAMFNVGQPIESCGRRDVTLVSSQALMLLNGSVAVEQARHFAGRLLRETGNDLDKTITRGWLLAFQRPISDNERVAAKRFLEARAKDLAEVDEDRRPTPLGDIGKHKINPARAAAVVEWCLALFNTNEFLFVD